MLIFILSFKEMFYGTAIVNSIAGVATSSVATSMQRVVINEGV